MSTEVGEALGGAVADSVARVLSALLVDREPDLGADDVVCAGLERACLAAMGVCVMIGVYLTHFSF